MKTWKFLAAFAACVLLTLAPALPAAEEEEGKEEEQEVKESGLVEEVIVTATRADIDSPVAFTNLSREKIEQEYWAQDVPALLASTPSAYSYSDSGNDIGYSYLRIRGFDQRRIAVTINGVPLNDAESHEVFWIDLPNFPDSLEDIQVQRGVGTSMYGANAIGGTVNLETARAVPGAGIVGSVGAGSFDTNKLSVGWTSDLLPGNWVFSGRLSRIATDGYRDQSWTRMAFAFFTAQRFGERCNLRINLYGGKEQSHLAYEGLTREQLAEDRRQNPLDWEGETDNFFQPHFEVIHEYHPTKKLEVGNTVYAFYGRGYYDQFRESKDLYELFLADVQYTEYASNVFRERWVKEWDVGWVPRVTWDHRGGRLTGGAELRFHRGRHWGEVEADDLPAGTPEDYRYYDYKIPKNSLVFFAQEEWRPTGWLTLLAALQRVDHSWKLERELVKGYSYDVTYAWWAPRVGANFSISDNWLVFASISSARREPSVKNLYDPTDAWSEHAFYNIDDSGFLSDPKPVEEKLTDYEAGFSYTSKQLMFRTTLYNMDFRDEIIYLGDRTDVGTAVTGNADRSVHRGIELEGRGRLGRDLELAGNLMLSDDKLKEFETYVPIDEYPWLEPRDLSGNRIAGFPNVLGRLSLSWNPSWGRLELGAFHAGRLYTDNTNDRERSIDPYTTVDFSARWKLNETYALRLRVNNLLDEEYESFGYVDWTTPVFIPAAGRNIFMMLEYKPARP
jgi:iron complex outermembrane receptor protein